MCITLILFNCDILSFTTSAIPYYGCLLCGLFSDILYKIIVVFLKDHCPLAIL